jgi:hypothetical protein
MNLDSLFIPARLAALMVEVKSFKKNELDGDVEGMILVPEGFLVRVFLEMGAVEASEIEKMNSTKAKNESPREVGVQYSENQDVDAVLPPSLVEIRRSDEGNMIRCILKYKGLTLKEVSERYGGKSGASNVANFLSKTDAELNQVRASTLARLAQALDCPLEWFDLLAEIGPSKRTMD